MFSFPCFPRLWPGILTGDLQLLAHDLASYGSNPVEVGVPELHKSLVLEPPFADEKTEYLITNSGLA
jgi:hypothetical protein